MSREVGVRHLGLGQVPPSLGGRGLPPSSIKPIKLLKGRLCPDDKSANMSSWSKFQNVEVIHLDCVHSWDVPESLSDPLVLVIHNKRSKLLDMSPVPQLSLSCPHSPTGIHLGHIGPGLVPPQELDSLLGLREPLCLVGHHEGHLRDVGDDVALGHNQGGHTSGGDSGAHGVPLLSRVTPNFCSPFAGAFGFALHVDNRTYSS